MKSKEITKEYIKDNNGTISIVYKVSYNDEPILKNAFEFLKKSIYDIECRQISYVKRHNGSSLIVTVDCSSELQMYYVYTQVDQIITSVFVNKLLKDDE